MAGFNKEATLAWLDEQGIPYEKLEHKAVFTMEEMDEAGISARGGVVKNPFLRDGKGKNHFLVIVPEEKRVNLIDLSAQLCASKLSFASADRLEKYLGVVQGAVSPLGILNDAEHVVEVVFDRDLCHAKKVGIHPNDSTATVWLSFKDLKKIIEKQGNNIHLLFLRPEIFGMDVSITEYYEMFPEAVERTSESFMTMLKQKDFMARDLESCKKCMEVGAITQKDAERLNRLVCLVYEGYLAMIRDGHYTDEQVQEKVILFIDDVDWLVMQLAKDLKGYQGYGK